MASDKPPRRALPPRYTKFMRAADLLVPRPEGLYCPPGDFHVDPTRPVARALVTHAHSDHATARPRRRPRHPRDPRHHGDPPRRRLRRPHRGGRPRHAAAHRRGHRDLPPRRPRPRLRPDRRRAGGFRIVASGDYKRTPDPTCAAFEPVPCDVFITEATFGLPVFRHPAPLGEIRRLLASLAQFPERTHLVGVYALGKAQRLLRLLRDAGYDAPVYLHGALRRLCDYYVARGIDLGSLADATVARGTARDFAGTIVLGPPSAFEGPWVRRFADPLDRLRLRLDAGSRPRPPARRRAAARRLRPLRLDRAHRRPSPSSPPPRSGSPTAARRPCVRWCALQAHSGARPSTSSATRTRQSRLSAPLRRAPRTPRLHPLAERQAPPDHRLPAHHPRPRPRLGPRRHHPRPQLRRASSRRCSAPSPPSASTPSSSPSPTTSSATSPRPSP